MLSAAHRPPTAAMGAHISKMICRMLVADADNRLPRCAASVLPGRTNDIRR
jgi:hypothetical protein